MHLIQRLFDRTTRARIRRLVNQTRPRWRPTLEALDERSLPSNSFTGLGAAGEFAVLGINFGHVRLHNAHVNGSVGLGPFVSSTLRNSDLSGALYVSPTASADLSHLGTDFLPAGGVVTQSLFGAMIDANFRSVFYSFATPTFSIGNLTQSRTVTGNGGTTIVNIGAVHYNHDTLTVSGGPSDVFVFNVAGGFSFQHSTVSLVGGVTANHVLFNFPTSGPAINLHGSTNEMNGTFLAPRRRVVLHGPAPLNGAIIARYVDMHSQARLNNVDVTPPTTAPASLSGFVYFDEDRDGLFDADEQGLPNVTLQLTGTNDLGQAVAQETMTDSNGFYVFSNLRPGVYSIYEINPDPINWEITTNTPGSLGGNNDTNYYLADIHVGEGQDGTDYNFGLAHPSG